MLRTSSKPSTLEVDMATADAHAPAPNYYGSKAKKNTLGSRKILAIAGIILGLTIFAMAVSIIDDGFHIVSSSFAFKNEATAYQLSMQVAACSVLFLPLLAAFFVLQFLV
jgi:hypothetical protein